MELASVYLPDGGLNEGTTKSQTASSSTGVDFEAPCRIRALALNIHKRELYTGGDDGLVRCWAHDSKDSGGRITRVLFAHAGWITSLLYATEWRLLLSASVDSRVIAWNPMTGDIVSAIKAVGPIYALSYDPSRRLLMCGVRDGVAIYRVGMDLSSPNLFSLRFHLRSHTDLCVHLAFYRDAARLFSAGYDGALVIYDSHRHARSMDLGGGGGGDGGEREREREREGAEEKGVMSARGEGGGSGGGKGWKKLSGVHHGGAITALYLHDAAETLFTAGYDRTVKVWSLDGVLKHKLESGLAKPVVGMCYVPAVDDLWLISLHAGAPRRFDFTRSVVQEHSAVHDVLTCAVPREHVGGLQGPIVWCEEWREAVGAASDGSLFTWRPNATANLLHWPGKETLEYGVGGRGGRSEVRRVRGVRQQTKSEFRWLHGDDDGGTDGGNGGTDRGVDGESKGHGHTDWVECLTYCVADHTTAVVYTGGADGQVLQWRVTRDDLEARPRAEVVAKHTAPITAIAYDPILRTVISADESAHIEWTSMDTDLMLSQLEQMQIANAARGEESEADRPALVDVAGPRRSNGGVAAASVSSMAASTLLDAEGMSSALALRKAVHAKHLCRHHTASVSAIAVHSPSLSSATTSTLFSGDDDGYLIAWDTLSRARQQLRRLPNAVKVTALAVSARLLIAGGDDGSLSLWSADIRAQCLSRLPDAHTASAVHRVLWDPYSRRVVSLDDDCVRAWVVAPPGYSPEKDKEREREKEREGETDSPDDEDTQQQPEDRQDPEDQQPEGGEEIVGEGEIGGEGEIRGEREIGEEEEEDDEEEEGEPPSFDDHPLLLEILDECSSRRGARRGGRRRSCVGVSRSPTPGDGERERERRRASLAPSDPDQREREREFIDDIDGSLRGPDDTPSAAVSLHEVACIYRPTESPLTAMAIDSATGCWAIGTLRSDLFLINPETSELIAEYSARSDVIRCVAHIAVADAYLIGCADHSVRGWRAPGVQMQQRASHGGRVPYMRPPADPLGVWDADPERERERPDAGEVSDVSGWWLTQSQQVHAPGYTPKKPKKADVDNDDEDAAQHDADDDDGAFVPYAVRKPLVPPKILMPASVIHKQKMERERTSKLVGIEDKGDVVINDPQQQKDSAQNDKALGETGSGESGGVNVGSAANVATANAGASGNAPAIAGASGQPPGEREEAVLHELLDEWHVELKSQSANATGAAPSLEWAVNTDDHKAMNAVRQRPMSATDRRIFVMTGLIERERERAHRIERARNRERARKAFTDALNHR